MDQTTWSAGTPGLGAYAGLDLLPQSDFVRLQLQRVDLESMPFNGRTGQRSQFC